MLFVFVVAVSAGAVAATGGSGLGVAAAVPVGLLGVGAAGSELIFLLAAAVAELTGFGCGSSQTWGRETPGCLIHSGPKLAEQWRRGLPGPAR